MKIEQTIRISQVDEDQNINKEVVISVDEEIRIEEFRLLEDSDGGSRLPWGYVTIPLEYSAELLIAIQNVHNAARP